MNLINNDLINSVSTHAKQSKRMRMNFNFHTEDTALFQRMLNALEPSTYIRPHKHENPDKSEAFIAIRGKMAVITFDDNGRIIQSANIEPCSNCLGVEIPPCTWHTIISLESGSVAYEAKDGPYNPDTDKIFAKWSPAEDSPEAVSYLEFLKSELR